MAESRKRKLGRTIAGWLVLLAGVTGGIVYSKMREPEISVTAAKLERGHVEQTVTAMASGTVEPKLDSMVAAGTMGQVIAIPVKEGARVKQDDVLVELDHKELDAQVALAEANLRVGQSRLEQAKIAASIYEEVARTRVAQADAQLTLAKLNFDRIRALSDKNAVSQSDFDKVAAALLVAQETQAAAKAGQQEVRIHQEDIRSADAAIEQLQAALTVATEMRDKAYVRAPFPGVVAKVLVEIGEAVGTGGLGSGSLGGGGGSGAGIGVGVNTGGTSMSGGMGRSVASAMGVVQLVEDSVFRVNAPFDEANSSLIKLGQKARIGLDAYRGVDFPGVVEYISPTVTRNLDLTRTLDIYVRIEEGQDKFIAGMSADVIIVADAKDDVLFVPSEALIRDEEVYVIENGHAVRRKIKVGMGNWQRREVLEGLKEGDVIVTSIGLKELKNGVRLRIVDTLDES